MSWKRIFFFLLSIFVIGWAANIKEKLTFSKDYNLQIKAVSAVLLDADTGK
jgi:hypothetical protein